MTAFGDFLLGAVVVLIVGTLIGVACLRAAIALNNWLAGGASSAAAVPVPSFEKAALVNFLTLALQLVGQAIVGQLIRTGTLIAGSHGKIVDAVEAAALRNVSLPVSLLALALMLTTILPTTFRRALNVSLYYLLVVTLVIGIVLAVIIAAPAVI